MKATFSCQKASNSVFPHWKYCSKAAECTYLVTPRVNTLRAERGGTNGTDPLKWNLYDFPCISTTFPSDRWDISSMLACPRDACLALAEIHANTHPRARRFRRELWRGSWSVTWSRRGIPVGLIKGMEQTAELIRDATRFLSLLSHSDFLFCSSLFP